MRLTLPTLLIGVALGGSPATYHPLTADLPMPRVFGPMQYGCNQAAHEGAVAQMRTLAMAHHWQSNNLELCAALFNLDHDIESGRLWLKVDNNADIWGDPRACRHMEAVARDLGWEWPGPDYRRGPR